MTGIAKENGIEQYETGGILQTVKMFVAKDERRESPVHRIASCISLQKTPNRPFGPLVHDRSKHHMVTCMEFKYPGPWFAMLCKITRLPTVPPAAFVPLPTLLFFHLFSLTGLPGLV